MVAAWKGWNNALRVKGERVCQFGDLSASPGRDGILIVGGKDAWAELGVEGAQLWGISACDRKTGRPPYSMRDGQGRNGRRSLIRSG